MTTTLSVFSSVRTVGTALPSEALVRAVDLLVPGQRADDYQLTPGMAFSSAITRAWDAARGAHRAWTAALAQLRPDDPATRLTRDKWLLPLLYELGYGRPEALPSGVDVEPGLGQTEPVHFPISHRLAWPPGAVEPAAVMPIHLVGGRVTLDARTPGVTARAPQSMVQDYLNRATNSLWGVVSNGHTLRVLRDASSLTKQSYVEFDLDDIFDNQRFADFRLFFLTIHASRFAPIPRTESPSPGFEEPVDGDGEPIPSAPSVLAVDHCWLEQWRSVAIADGARALEALRGGVARALQLLGTGFVSHPANALLREELAQSSDAGQDLRRALLRIAYQLIVLFVVEDRGLLHTASADIAAQQLYVDYYSTARLRRLATTRVGTRHSDMWPAQLIVTDALARDGLPALALPGLGASLFDRETLGILRDAKLSNKYFLAAVRELAEITDRRTGQRRRVDYRNLDSEELGGVYEGLLAYEPRYHPASRTFTLDEAKGNERKKSGSYYTPSELIALVLDEALDPLIAEAIRAPDPEQALLAMTVVDPAVGSGHFVVAAARRIAIALAAVRSGDMEPSPVDLRTATADVIERCIYGVDINDLAVEIAKVALWLEAFDGSRPWPFLDAHLKVGNSLLGATPALLRKNIPDEAFRPLTGDDPEWARKLKARNKAERRAADQLSLFDSSSLNVETSALSKRVRDLESRPPATLVEAQARVTAWSRFDKDPDLAARKLAADTWCAAFVQPKTLGDGIGITHDTLRCIVENPTATPKPVEDLVKEAAERYRFFHWHLEFPGIFSVPDDLDADVDPATGWRGGFTCVLGNVPWERIKIQDKEWFAANGRDDVANAKTAAIRARMIDDLADEDPELHGRYRRALRTSDGAAHLLLRAGRYPLTGQGDVNTYSVFAETMRAVVAPRGAAGIVTPTGLATDKTTAPFFADILKSGHLIAFYDFENEARIFAGIDHRVRFAVSVIAGSSRGVVRTRFAFLTRYLVDIPGRRFELAAAEVLMMNPNTGTLPMFRTREDADITLGIYRRRPVLIRDGHPDGNPWNLSFGTLFHMANDSGLFNQPTDLAHLRFNGWSYEGDDEGYLPLYEAKMLGHFDHRFSTYRDATQAQLNVGSLPRLSAQQDDDPYLEPLARYWVNRVDVEKQLEAKGWDRDWLLGWRDITNATNARTFIPCVLPASATGHKFPIALPADAGQAPLLHSVWSSQVFDYIARQKLSGTGMTYFIVKQLACPMPATFACPPAWQQDCTLEQWVVPYVLELSYTSWLLRAYARDLGDEGSPFRWDLERRALLRADLDGAFMHVYGLTRPEVEHVLDSFFVVRKYEERDFGEFRTRRLTLEAYDRMTEAIARGGHGWAPLAGIPAGQGPRHPDRPTSERQAAEA